MACDRPRIFRDVRIVLEIKLRRKRYVQQLRNPEMDVSRSGQACIFLSPGRFGGTGYRPGMMVSNS